MARWDQPGITWDSGVRYDATDDPASQPESKPKKTMRRQAYYPSRIGDQVVWLQNFKTKLPNYTTPLSLDATEVAARVLDAENAIYGLDDNREVHTHDTDPNDPDSDDDGLTDGTEVL